MLYFWVKRDRDYIKMDTCGQHWVARVFHAQMQSSWPGDCI